MGRDNQSFDIRDELGSMSRRKLLALSTGAMASVAGCSSGSDSPGGSDNTSKNDQGGAAVTTELSSHFAAWQPSKTNFNPYSPPGNEPSFTGVFWWEALLWRNNKGEICYFLIDDVEFKSGCEVLYHFKKGFHWWDGTPVTAEDWLVGRKITQYQTYGSPAKAPMDVSLVDKYTLKESRDTPVNPTVRKLGLAEAMGVKADYYQDWLDKYEKASSKDEVEKVTSELTRHEVSIDEFVDKGLGCGMWKLKKWNPTQVTYEKFDGHPRSDWTNLETWKWILVSGDQKFNQAFMDGRFDMGELNFKLVEKNDRIENVAKFPLPGVPKLTFNFANKHLGRRNVRRAIAYLIDHKEIRKFLKVNYGTPYLKHPYICGMGSKIGKKWVGKDHLKSLIDYGGTAKPEKAKQAMYDAGYTKQGDTWVGPDGDAVTGLKYMTPPWSIYQKIEEYLSDKLDEFGIKNKALKPSSSNFYKRLNKTYDFDLLNWYHFGFHPVNTYYTGVGSPVGLDNYVPAVKHPKKSSSKGCSVNREAPELKMQRSPRLSQPIRPKFPKQVGSKQISGGGQTLYPIKWNNIMGQSQKRDEIIDLAKKLSWYYNWQLPHIGFYEEVWNYWAHTDTYNFRDNHPKSETEITAREHTIPNEDSFQMKGHVTAKTE